MNSTKLKTLALTSSLVLPFIATNAAAYGMYGKGYGHSAWSHPHGYSMGHWQPGSYYGYGYGHGKRHWMPYVGYGHHQGMWYGKGHYGPHPTMKSGYYGRNYDGGSYENSGDSAYGMQKTVKAKAKKPRHRRHSCIGWGLQYPGDGSQGRGPGGDAARPGAFHRLRAH